MNQTKNILTTRKLQSLLDACVNPDVPNRRALAAAMTELGNPISVHGIDAWFKRNDSNYAIERESLHPQYRSFAIPRPRWLTVLEVFKLHESDLNRDDDEFRDWIYARNFAPNQKASASGSIALYHGKKAHKAARMDADWLASRGFDVKVNVGQADGSEHNMLRSIKQADAMLLYLDQEYVKTEAFAKVLSVVRGEGLAIVCIGLDDAEIDRDTLPVLAGQYHVSEPYAEALEDCIVQAINNIKPSADQAARSSVQDLITTRPSIAVLPFANFTGDEAWDQLADAMAEDITLTLARLPELFVITSSTMRMYQGQVPDSRQVAEELGVRYVLEGTIRVAAEGTVRVTAQLVDATIRRGMWSNRFDRKIDTPYEVLDELTIAICAQLEPEIRYENIREGSELSSAPAWRLWQEGWHYLFVDAPVTVPTRSIELFKQALNVDPDYPLAHAGYSIGLSAGMLWGGLDLQCMPSATKHAEIAYRALPDNAGTNYAMAMLLFVQANPLEQVITYMEKAVTNEPSNAIYHASLGYLLGHLGETKRGLECARYALRLSPHDAPLSFLSYVLGNVLIADGQFNEAIDTFTRATAFSKVDLVLLFVAYAYFRTNHTSKALAALHRIDHPRPIEFYRYALLRRMWLSHADEIKNKFLELVSEATAIAATESQPKA